MLSGSAINLVPPSVRSILTHMISFCQKFEMRGELRPRFYKIIPDRRDFGGQVMYSGTSHVSFGDDRVRRIARRGKILDHLPQ